MENPLNRTRTKSRFKMPRLEILLHNQQALLPSLTSILDLKIRSKAKQVCTKPTTPHYVVTNFRANIMITTIRANLYPEVTDLFCRFPLPTLFYRLEAAHLGDLMRLWVRSLKNSYYSLAFSRTRHSCARLRNPGCVDSQSYEPKTKLYCSFTLSQDYPISKVLRA